MANQAAHNTIAFHVGDTVKVHYKIVEKETIAGKTKKSSKTEIKERIQPFEGIVIAIHGEAENKSVTIRRIGAGNIGIERIFPISSPWIEKISVTKAGNSRRAKLYYIREKSQVDTARKLA